MSLEIKNINRRYPDNSIYFVTSKGLEKITIPYNSTYTLTDSEMIASFKKNEHMHVGNFVVSTMTTAESEKALVDIKTAEDKVIEDKIDDIYKSMQENDIDVSINNKSVITDRRNK